MIRVVYPDGHETSLSSFSAYLQQRAGTYPPGCVVLDERGVELARVLRDTRHSSAMFTPHAKGRSFGVIIPLGWGA